MLLEVKGKPTNRIQYSYFNFDKTQKIIHKHFNNLPILGEDVATAVTKNEGSFCDPTAVSRRKSGEFMLYVFICIYMIVLKTG